MTDGGCDAGLICSTSQFCYLSDKSEMLNKIRAGGLPRIADSLQKNKGKGFVHLFNITILLFVGQIGNVEQHRSPRSAWLTDPLTTNS